MVGLVYATQREAQPLLDQSAADALARRPFPRYQIRPDGIQSAQVIISGMGKVAAAMAGAYLVMDQRVSVLVSAGLCGGLNPDCAWSVGDLFRITAALEGDCDRFGRAEPSVVLSPQWFRHLPGARLVTCDRPVFDAGRRDHLIQLGDLADMEGAAVARVAQLWGIDCAMVKGISDAADERGRQAVADNIDWVSARIARAVWDELIQMTDA